MDDDLLREFHRNIKRINIAVAKGCRDICNSDWWKNFLKFWNEDFPEICAEAFKELNKEQTMQSNFKFMIVGYTTDELGKIGNGNAVCELHVSQNDSKMFEIKLTMDEVFQLGKEFENFKEFLRNGRHDVPSQNISLGEPVNEGITNEE